MNAIIIIIGDEILLGQVLDTNSEYIARELTGIGLDVIEILTIPDKRDKIYDSVVYAMERADLIVVTGGLGPTKDDVTKKVLAEYFDSNLALNRDALTWITELLKNRGIAINENNKSQALLPDNCRLLHNYKGTASGMWFEKDSRVLISLPGVPFEMIHLMETYVIPDLKEEYPDLQLKYRVLKVYDIPESELAEQLETWEENLGEGLGLAYLPSPGWVRLRITAKGEAVNVLDSYYESLKLALKGLRYTEGEESSIERQFGELFRSKGLTVATAESCTGGYLAHLITAVPGSSDYYKGGIVAYSNEIKTDILGVNRLDIEREGAVSETVVRQMAEGIKRLTRADYAVSTSGVAGPDGGTPEKPIGTVWIGIATPTKTTARKFTFSFTRERNISKAALKAMELLINETGC